MAKEDYLKSYKVGEERARINGAKGGKAKTGTLHLSTRIQQMMSDDSFEQKLKDGTILKGAPIEAILKVAIAKARTGDVKFMDWLAKYGYGTKIDLTSNGDTLNIALVEFVGEDNEDESEQNEDSNTDTV